MARTALLAGFLVLAVLATAAAVAAFGTSGQPSVTRTGEPTGVVVETPVPLDERVPPTRQEPLPDLVLDGFEGAAPVDLTAYRGQPLLLNFWASWCAPCIEEMPDIEEVASEYRDRLAVLGVNTRDARANAAAFATDLGITYDLAADPEGDLFVAIGAFGMPTTLFVTPEGTIVYRHTGLLDAEGLRVMLRERLGVETP